MDEQTAAYNNHCDEVFDRLTDGSLRSCFGGIVGDCFAVRYTSGEELVKALESAYESWTGEHREVGVRILVVLVRLADCLANSAGCERREC
jgi:hypothetical protein